MLECLDLKNPDAISAIYDASVKVMTRDGTVEEKVLQAVIEEENPLPAPVPMNYVSDLSLIKQELDWKPEIRSDEGLKTLFG